LFVGVFPGFLIFLCQAYIKGNIANFKAQLICSETEMAIYLTSTEEDFTGVIYTEGSYKDPDCYQQAKGGQKFLFKVPFDKCKTVEEDGQYSNVVVIQHHERIMTGDDAAFRVVCDKKNMRDPQVIVTESMYMVHEHESEGKGEAMKPQLKELYNNKKIKTIYTDKGTITYVNSKNKTSKSLVMGE